MPSQDAGGGLGQSAGNKFVKFSRQSAQRIAKVVRTVEAGNRSQGGIVFDHPMQSPAGGIRICNHTGAWAKNSTSVVTFAFRTNTPNTASVMNLMFEIPTPDTPATNKCIIGRDGTAWYLIQYEHAQTTMVTEAKIVGDELQFPRKLVAYVGASTGASVISLVTCSAS